MIFEILLDDFHLNLLTLKIFKISKPILFGLPKHNNVLANVFHCLYSNTF